MLCARAVGLARDRTAPAPRPLRGHTDSSEAEAEAEEASSGSGSEADLWESDDEDWDVARRSRGGGGGVAPAAEVLAGVRTVGCVQRFRAREAAGGGGRLGSLEARSLLGSLQEHRDCGEPDADGDAPRMLAAAVEMVRTVCVCVRES